MSFAGIDLCQLAAGTPPDGQVSNLVNPPSLAAATLGIAVSTTSIALFFTVARIWVNIRKLGPADYFVMIAIVLSITYSALCIALRKWSRHIWDVPVCWITGEYMQLLFAQAMTYAVTTFFAKSSVLLLYLQLFAVQRRTRVAIWAGLIFMGILYWAAFPIEVPFMTPYKGQTWQELALSGRPSKIGVWGIVQGPLSVLVDLYIFVLPFPVLAKLKLSRRRRIELLVVFATAFLAVIASVIGLAYRVKIVYSADVTWSNGTIFFCTMFETNITIIVSCMPAAAGFAKTHIAQTTFIKSLRSTLFSSNNKSNASEPKSWGNGVAQVTFGQGSDRSKAFTGRSQRNYHELTDLTQSGDDVATLVPREDTKWETAISTHPISPPPARISSNGPHDIIQTTELTQQYSAPHRDGMLPSNVIRQSFYVPK